MIGCRLLLVAMFFCPLACSALADDRPNVIVVLADDQGWGDLSLHGNPNLSTPRIDSLARDGAQISHFYVCPVCSPTRAEFLTGRYHTRMNVYSTSAGGERFDADETTIADAFRNNGYATACYGKWHSGMQYPYHPNARGFDDFYGFCSGHWGHYFSPMLEHNGKIVQGEGFLPDDLTHRAISFIDQQKDKPFFVYLALNTPHSPMQVPDQYWTKFKNRELVPDPALENQKGVRPDHARAALAMCENIDDNVGRLLDHLKSRKLVDNTIVVYFSDNGPNGKRFNGGMRGRKGSTFEGGVRSPCLIRYPDAIPAGIKVQSIAGAIDLFPTLSDLANVTFEPPRPFDGLSIRRELAGETVDRERILISAWNGKTSARSSRFRMQHRGGLFDLENDPGERNDVSTQHPEVAKKLSAALRNFEQNHPSRRANQRMDRPITLGHPDAIWTQLPARDATVTGTITRSNRYPNCTFMQNWTDSESTIRWDTDVFADGTFEVQMYYSCRESDVGSTIELRIGDAKLRSKILNANDVPLVGAQEDRFERMEGYVRRWKPMTLGTINLTAGRQKTVLSAPDVAGAEVANMRLLMFRRLEGNSDSTVD